MSLDPIKKDVKITPADLPEFDLGTDPKTLEDKASIFVQKTKFVPVDENETVKLVEVGKDGQKILYEDQGQMHLARSQSELAKEKANRDDLGIAGLFGGLFSKSKSVFGKKDDLFG